MLWFLFIFLEKCRLKIDILRYVLFELVEQEWTIEWYHRSLRVTVCWLILLVFVKTTSNALYLISLEFNFFLQYLKSCSHVLLVIEIYLEYPSSL